MKVAPLIIALACLTLVSCKRTEREVKYTEQQYTGSVGQYPINMIVATSEESDKTTETDSPQLRSIGRFAGNMVQSIGPDMLGIGANALLPGTGGIVSSIAAGAAAYFFGKRQQKKQMESK